MPVAKAIEQLASDGISTSEIRLVCTAHSIPESMSSTSDYEKQLQESCHLICEELDWPARSSSTSSIRVEVVDLRIPGSNPISLTT
ncbi:MAG: ferrochelatase [Planctomycetaceae bacterium]